VPRAVPAGLVTGLLLLVLCGAAVTTAAPALAVDDPSRPQSRVTHGPSCGPGGVVIEVTARSVGYAVRLATTRTPAGEDEATLKPGATATLRTGEVAWGETIDSRLEYTALDGSGTSYVDELEDWTFTRPTREDCAAATAAPSSAASSSAPSSAAAPGSDAQQTPPSTAAGGAAPSSAAPGSARAPAAPAWNTGSAAVQAVGEGGTVTLRGTGFRPGERVTVHLNGSDTVLTAVTAGPDGTVLAEITVPDAGNGDTVALVGDSSAVTADVRLRPLAMATPVDGSGLASLTALVAAAVALVGTVAGLVSVIGRQRTTGRPIARTRSA
jgi:hypothetical protein